LAGIGGSIVRLLSQGEEHLGSWLSLGWTWALLLAYLAAWIVVSVPLQRQTSLMNWVPNSYLLVGTDGSSESPWKGKVFRLQIWDQAIPDRLVQEMTSRGLAYALDPTPLADYDFSLPPPVRDQQHFLPDLSWSTTVPPAKSTGHPEQVGNPWLASQGPVTRLVSALQKTNQFTVRIVCKPPKAAGPEGAIASIAQPAGMENLGIWQQGTDLAFWFRSLVTINPWRTWHPRWSVSEVLPADQVRDILISYDGSKLSFYVDGKEDRHSTQLGPGVGLARLFHRAKAGEMQIYNHIYYLVMFLPGGCFLGISARKVAMRKLSGPLLFGFFISPLALQIILLHVSGGFFSYSNFALSFLLTVGAALWINCDRTILQIRDHT